MSKFVKGMVVAATIVLAGCGTTAHRQAETVTADSRPTVETIRVCENALYYASDDDLQTTLHCANILDIWQ